jgi:hypothetical protein
MSRVSYIRSYGKGGRQSVSDARASQDWLRQLDDWRVNSPIFNRGQARSGPVALVAPTENAPTVPGAAAPAYCL